VSPSAKGSQERTRLSVGGRCGTSMKGSGHRPPCEDCAVKRRWTWLTAFYRPPQHSRWNFNSPRGSPGGSAFAARNGGVEARALYRGGYPTEPPEGVGWMVGLHELEIA
jgi:hypothetical protein